MESFSNKTICVLGHGRLHQVIITPSNGTLGPMSNHVLFIDINPKVQPDLCANVKLLEIPLLETFDLVMTSNSTCILLNGDRLHLNVLNNIYNMLRPNGLFMTTNPFGRPKITDNLDKFVESMTSSGAFIREEDTYLQFGDLSGRKQRNLVFRKIVK